MLLQINKLDNEIDELEEIKNSLMSALTNDMFYPLLGNYHNIIFKIYKEIQNKIAIRQKQILSMISKEIQDIEQIMKGENNNENIT